MPWSRWGSHGYREDFAGRRPAQRPRKARMHTRGPNGITAVDHEIPQTPEFHMGGGGLYSTVSDYLRFT